MNIFRLFTLSLFVTSLTGCNTAGVIGTPAESDLAAISEFNKYYLQAINEGDIDLLESLTTEDHIMISSGRSPLSGKEANINAMRGAFERFDIDETWTPVETVIEGRLAYQRGTYTVKATPKSGGESNTISGNFLRIYKRQTNGDWRMVRDMFTTDQPVQ